MKESHFPDHFSGSINNNFNHLQTRLREWYASFPGQSMLPQIRNLVTAMLGKTYGYHALQIGSLEDAGNLLEASDLLHSVHMAEAKAASVTFLGEPTALPVQAKSTDLILLLHTLDTCDDPYQTLREVDRALADDGHVLILGFNPWSIWGGLRLFMRWRNALPWQAHFYRLQRVQDWLGVLGFKPVQQRTLYFQPPFKNEKIIQKLRFMRYLHYVLPFCGALYLIKAQKQTANAMPLRTRWLPRRKFVPGGLVRPTSRNHHE